MVLNTPWYSSHMLENRFLLEFDMVADGLLEAGSESSMFQGSSGLSAKGSSYSVAYSPNMSRLEKALPLGIVHRYILGCLKGARGSKVAALSIGAPAPFLMHGSAGLLGL